mmetsp:Transcript_14113/g.46082  ORF Transcript_14113/g.46082 Transcript_14113/m.46082 type:complete len:323 (+) Transcript_14113:346-1314(+)
MIRTAEANEVPWTECVAWIARQDFEEVTPTQETPAYYRSPFHAYASGNLCWKAAFEQEIASAAVGARNYPQHGRAGEDAFRSAFEYAFDELGADVPEEGVVVDVGCGTGTSTRRLAAKFESAKEVVGVDLSPYFLTVGRKLLELEPTTDLWVSEIRKDDRIRFVSADAAAMPFEDASVDVCQLNLVVHECPPSATKAILRECKRVLKPEGGQLWISEMDFDTPGFKNLRANPLLFSLIRSTEPMLDLYADYNARGLAADLVDLGFHHVKIRAATGRHFALVATTLVGGQETNEDERLGVIDDRRLETALPDTHLATWAVESR